MSRKWPGSGVHGELPGLHRYLRRASRRLPCLALGASVLVQLRPAAAEVVAADEDQASPATSAATQKGPAEPTPHRLKWRWLRFGPIDYAATIILEASYLYVEFGTDQPEQAKWTGPILFDKAVRSGMVAGSRDGRSRADVLSDYLLALPLAALWAETIVVPVFLDEWNVDVAWQMTLINVQSSALTGLLVRGGHRTLVRERPSVQQCERDPDYSRYCFRTATSGFPSGHTSMAFTGAALSCTHHLNLPLYGGGAFDVAMCAVLGTAAATSGVLRMVADRHYVSDVLAGATIGIGSGFALPMLLHYRDGEAEAKEGSVDSATAIRWTLAPFAASDGPGLSVYGWF